MALCRGVVIFCALLAAQGLHVQTDPERGFRLEIVVRDNKTKARPADPGEGCKIQKTAVVASVQHSGSKNLAAIVGIWMTMADPNYAGAHFQSDFEPSYFARLRKDGVSQLILEEQPANWVTGIADVMLTSHRSPFDALTNSKLLSGQGDCVEEMQHQHAIYESAKACCNGVAFDMDDRLVDEGARQAVRTAGLALGLCNSMLTQDWINYVFNIFLDNKPPEPAKGKHSKLEEVEAQKYAHDLVFGTTQCKAWFERGGRYQDELDMPVEMTKATLEVDQDVSGDQSGGEKAFKEIEYRDSERRAYGMSGPYP